tara:strand:+ start:477 stop:764 length:288 start_codon:yes stop_codon:yes gene_type:complete
MSDQQIRDNVRKALYVSVLNKMIGDLSELEAKEVLLVNTCSYITSAEHDHAEHIKELYKILKEKVDLQHAIKDVRTAYFTNLSPQGHVPDVKKNS